MATGRPKIRKGFLRKFTYQKQIQALKSKRDEIEKKVSEISRAGDNAWEDLKAGVDLAWEAMSEAIKSATLFTLFPAFNETVMAAEEAPDTVQEVALSIKDTVLDMWTNFVDRIPFLASGLAVLLITWFAAAFLSKIFDRLLRRSKLRRSLQSLILRFIDIAVWIIGLLLAAMIVFPGLTPAKALGGMGIASVAIGFAFRDIFENFFAGVLLLWRFPFENGDYIECQGISGRVENISIRMTTIRLVSGELVVMPNSVLFKNPVEVLTSQRKRRVTIIMIRCGRFAELSDRAWLFIIEGDGQKKRGDQCE